MATSRDIYGDGSGLNQSGRGGSIATWSVARIDYDGTGHAPRNIRVTETARGQLEGWFQTVPRAELTALEFSLRHMSPDGCYVGDCAFAIEGAAAGVPPHLRSAASFNADLWRSIHRRILDVGPQVSFRKTKAHRSLEQAEADPEDGVLCWWGNRCADHQCKSLAKSIDRHQGTSHLIDFIESIAVDTITVASASVAWAFKHLGALEPPRAKAR